MNILTTVGQETEKVKDRIKQPDHPFWKRLGDIMIYIVIPAAELIAPRLPPPFGTIIGVAVPVLSVIIKGASKLTKDKAILHTNNNVTWKKES